MAVPALSQTVQQADSVDSKEVTLSEVTVTSAIGAGQKVAGKGRAASIEEHLLQLGNVEMIRRGSYA